MSIQLPYERPFIQKLNTGSMNKFGTKTEFAPVTHLEGVAVSKIIKEYGSPCFVISERQIRKNYQTAVRAFKTRYPKVQYAWSYKTNYLSAVCNIFHQEGSWAEVVSIFEYKKALQNGVDGSKILFNGPDKSTEDLELAIKNNSLIHIDHFDELYTLVGLLEGTEQKARVAIRVNMDTGIYPMWDRFGFNYENGQAWNALIKIMAHKELELVGLHCHIGTYMLSTSAYATAAYKLCDLAINLKAKYGLAIQYLDLGGGFASTNTLKGSYLQGADIIPQIDDYAEAITSTILNFGFSQDELPTLILESGRVLIDDAAWLVGSVVASKRLSDGRRATIMDFGVNLLFNAFWYDYKISPAQEFTHHTEDMVIYGPLCMNIDCIRENINLPLLNKGDQVVVHKVGAYNMTQWMQFIQMRPRIVLIDMQGQTHVLRENESLDTMMELERIPTHLQSSKING
ncbi:MAG: diaminopimelate decarboxylase [Flavobacteriales bacterium]|nr:diaminopimelate decarboxylase [Flavobacteriales bacterium]NCA20571.1 diaminopimelate decarboxylase [Crocinitomicaceae bacterium]